MSEKLSSSFDGLLKESRHQMDRPFGTNTGPARATSPVPSVAPQPSPASVIETQPEQAPAALQSGHISGTAKGVPFSLKIGG